ncbi:MAG: D-alanyl-D-alanine carboxypeptidase/D-alanyl-D-alanine endopeptidase [Thermoanaerobaculia bacterium]
MSVAASDETLAGVLAEIEADPVLGRAIWTLDARDGEGRTIASKSANQLMATASVRKLFTAALVAECEDLSGPIPTEVVLSGTQGAQGIWDGALVILAAGDPTIGGRWEYETDRLRRLRPVAEELKRRGIRRIRDGVVVDVAAFERSKVGGAWKWDNVTYSYAAPIDAAAFNENAIVAHVSPRGCNPPVVEVEPSWIKARTETDCGALPFGVTAHGPREVVAHGSVRDLARDTVFLAQRHPAEALGDAMRVALEESGIVAYDVASQHRARRAEGRQRDVRIARIESQPVGALLHTVLAESSNLYSEMLFKRASRSRGVASWEGSLAIERDFLVGGVGLDPTSFRFDDGCGLSPENLVTARSTVDLVRYLRTQSVNRVFWEGVLAKPGEEGTLRRRLPQLKGRLFAKTGTIDGVAALAGWLRREDGSIVDFAIFVNNHAAPPRDVSRAIDRIVTALAR